MSLACDGGRGLVALVDAVEGLRLALGLGDDAVVESARRVGDCCGLAAGLRLPGAYLLRFFAGFCLVANGGYIGGGSFDRLGGAGQMLRHGSPPWLLGPLGQ